MDSKALSSFGSKSKDTTSESMKTNGKDGELALGAEEVHTLL